MNDSRSDPFAERLSEYVDGELASREREELERHLEGCADCRAIVADFRSLGSAARALPSLGPARDLWPAIERGIESASIGRSRGPWFMAGVRLWPGVAVAAALALFLLGLWAGANLRETQPSTAPGPGASARFVLFLHEPSGHLASATPEEMERIIGEYSAWARAQRDAGALELGEKLADGEGFDLFAEDTEPRSASVWGEALGGLFLVRAADYDAALAIARSCPHLKYGGWIELRRIQET